MQRAILFFFLVALLPFGAGHATTVVFINNNPAVSTQSEQFVSSTPADNQTVDAPAAVVITFLLPINPDKSSIKVYDNYGTQINDGKVTVNNTAMSATLPTLGSGRYAVKWKTRCMCDDNNTLNDEFHFTVR